MLWSLLSFSVVISVVVDGGSDRNASLYGSYPIPSASHILISLYLQIQLMMYERLFLLVYTVESWCS
jgi:hypothetical protein